MSHSLDPRPEIALRRDGPSLLLLLLHLILLLLLHFSVTCGVTLSFVADARLLPS